MPDLTWEMWEQMCADRLAPKATTKDPNIGDACHDFANEQTIKPLEPGHHRIYKDKLKLKWPPPETEDYIDIVVEEK